MIHVLFCLIDLGLLINNLGPAQWAPCGDHFASICLSFCPSNCLVEIAYPKHIFFLLGLIWLIPHPQSAFGYRLYSDLDQVSKSKVKVIEELC